MFTQPDIRLDLADQIHRERLAEAERSRIAAAAGTLPQNPRPAPRRLARARAVLAFAGARIFS